MNYLLRKLNAETFKKFKAICKDKKTTIAKALRKFIESVVKENENQSN